MKGQWKKDNEAIEKRKNKEVKEGRMKTKDKTQWFFLGDYGFFNC